MKFKRAITSKATGVALDDENYAELSVSQQLIANLAEAYEVEVVVSEYEKRFYISIPTVLALAKAIQES